MTVGKNVISRIEELERQKPSKVICLARNLKTGEEREMPILELVERGFEEWEFVRVLEGGNLDDIWAYFDALFNYYGWKGFQ